MLRWILRLLTRPVLWPLALLLRWFVRRALGTRGVLELHLDRSVREPWLGAAELERLVVDSRARGVLLVLEGFGLGWAAAEQWRAMLNRLRDRGVLVAVHADGLDNLGLMLASAADRVYLTPLGEVTARGPGGQLTFFGRALAQVGLRFDVEAVGAYKSFGEAYTRAWGSAESREALGAVLDDLRAALVRAVSRGRGLSAEQVEAALAEAPLGAERARELGLVDGLLYRDGLDPALDELLGEDLRLVPVGPVARAMRWAELADELFARGPAVVVVHLRGPVTLGDEPDPGGRARIAAREVNPVLEALRDDPAVLAVVLHIDSGGGSALASDLIWRELELLNRVKPLIAHLGDTAASGAYYIAAPALEIVALPTTITGSIGVFGGKLVVGQAAGRLGIFAETLGARSPYGPFQPFDAHERERFRERLLETYTTFLARVSAGRRRPLESVHKVAQGRIWSGRAAVDQGLVDHLGDLDLAVERARARAGIRPGQAVARRDLLILPARPWWMRFLPEELQGRMQSAGPLGWLRSLGVELPVAAELLLRHPERPLALLPMDLELR